MNVVLYVLAVLILLLALVAYQHKDEWATFNYGSLPVTDTINNPNND